jgi:putative transposase
LNESWFTTVANARATIEAWRQDYNTQRLHNSLGDLTPDEFEQCTINRAPEPTLSS